MKKKILGLLGSALLLAACETGPDQNVNVSSSATPGSREHFNETAGNRVYFDTNTAHLTPEAKKVLEAQAGWLKEYHHTTAVVDGHCDERGTREFNLALGAKRAAAVKHGLTHHGIAKKRLQTVSKGKDDPQTPGTGEAVWAQNRTAITVIQ